MSIKKPKTVVRIEIEILPIKTSYFTGEFFDPTGMVVRAYYSDFTNGTTSMYLFSPTNPLKLSDTSITVSFLGQSAILPITVIDRFPFQNIKNAELGDGPYYNLFDFSLRFISDTMSVGRDSYSLPFNLAYHSRMSSVLSNKCVGLPARFKTNYHQLIIQDGYDENDNHAYKYIDGDGYVHSFYRTTDHIYYCNDDDLYLVVDADNTSFYAEIIDAHNNKLLFNSDGLLYQIIDGYDCTNIKNIIYSNGKISLIYDSRNSASYIQYSYDLNNDKLNLINFVYRNETIKALALNYNNDGFLISVVESANNQSRTLYNFSYNSDSSNSSFNCIDMINDRLNHKAYRFGYDYISEFNDCAVNTFETGYLNSNDAFIVQKSLTRSSYSLRYDNNRIPNEIRLVNQNNKIVAFSLDKNAQITATFGDPNGDQYKTLYKEKGIYLPITGDTTVYVNSSRFKSLSGTTLTISLTNAACLLYQNNNNFVLRFYLKLNGYFYKRIKASVSANPNYIFSSLVEVNVNQYGKYQLVEIPFSKISSIFPFSPDSLILSIEDEYGLAVNASVGDFYLDKSARTVLLFQGETRFFEEVTDIGIYDSYSDTEPVRKISLSGETTFSIEDFLKTFKHPSNAFSSLLYQYDNLPNKKPIYLNNGRVFDFYSYRFTLFAGNTIIFNSMNPGNVDLGTSNTWCFVNASFDGRTYNRTYYRYAYYYFQIVNRTQTGNNEFTWREEVKSYDPITERLSKTTDSHKFFLVILSNDTNYEYFSNGELKKVTQVCGNETIVLYEASQDSNGYISRKTSGISSSDITYNRYLENVITHNQNNSGVISNSDYTKELSYDNFYSSTNCTAFKYDGTNRCSNHLDVDYINNETSIYVNTSSLYKITVNESNTVSTCERYNGYSYNNVLSVEQADLFNETIFYGSNNTVITNVFDAYGRITQQLLNNQNKVLFSYQTNIECPSAAFLKSVVDSYINKTITYSHSNGNRSETIDFDNGFEIEKMDNGHIIYSFDNEASYYSLASGVAFISVFSNNDYLISFSTAYYHDIYNRLTSKQRANSNDFSNVFLSDNYSFNVGSSLISSFTHVDELQHHNHVAETYSYDVFGNVSSISTTFRDEFDNQINNVSYTRTFAFDGFNRLLTENNSLVSFYSRSYSYSNDGKMEYFGNNYLSYNNNGQLECFGSVEFEYDNYGNRLTKALGNNVTAYSYERGKLLSSVTSNGKTVTFTYDYLGRRYQKDSFKETVTYFYDGNRLIGENHVGKSYMDESGNPQTGLTFQLRFFYHIDGTLNGLRLIYIQNNETQKEDYAYIVNAFNEIVGLSRIYYDSNYISTSLDVNYIYDAWGNHKVYNMLGQESNNSAFIGYLNPFRYKGYYYDQETGLYFLQSRYYDPSVAQFISPDDCSYLNSNSISGYHLYAYCNNNPIMNTDNTGHIAVSTIFLLLSVGVGAVIGATSNIVSQYLSNGGDWDGFDYTSLIWNTLIGGIGGALAMSSFGAGTMIVANGALGAISAIGNNLIAGADFSSSRVVCDIAISTICGLASGWLGGPGAMHGKDLGVASSNLIKAVNSYSNVMAKAAAGLYSTSRGAHIALSITHNAFIRAMNKLNIMTFSIGKSLFFSLLANVSAETMRSIICGSLVWDW